MNWFQQQIFAKETLKIIKMILDIMEHWMISLLREIFAVIRFSWISQNFLASKFLFMIFKAIIVHDIIKCTFLVYLLLISFSDRWYAGLELYTGRVHGGDPGDQLLQIPTHRNPPWILEWQQTGSGGFPHEGSLWYVIFTTNIFSKIWIFCFSMWLLMIICRCTQYNITCL